MRKLLGQLASRRGQALSEFAVAFPLQLLITLGIIQLSLIIVGAIVVDYAAEAAARAVLVGEDPHQAAALVCSQIAGSTSRGAIGQGISVPGWGVLPRSAQSLQKTHVNVTRPLYVGGSGPLDETQPLHADTATIEAYVHHDFELIIPVVDLLGSFVFGGHDIQGARHITLTARGTQKVPWGHEPVGVGHPVIPDIRDTTATGQQPFRDFPDDDQQTH